MRKLPGPRWLHRAAEVTAWFLVLVLLGMIGWSFWALEHYRP